MSVSFSGHQDVLRQMYKLAEEMPKIAGRALRMEAELIMTRSKEEFVPYDEGKLRASGRVVGPTNDERGVGVSLVYGGAAAAYAIAVHETPSKFDPPSWKGGVTFKHGGPKYLERPLMDALPELPARMVARMQKEMARLEKKQSLGSDGSGGGGEGGGGQHRDAYGRFTSGTGGGE